MKKQPLRIGGVAGYSIQAFGYRFTDEYGSNPAKNVYHTLQLWRDQLLFKVQLDCEFADVERGITDSIGAAIRPDDLRWLVDLARTVYARRAMDCATAAKEAA